MVKQTNVEKVVTGQASSSRRRKRQQLPSVVEDEVENGGGTVSVNGNIDGDEVIPKARSGTLLDLDLLDCPVCWHALTKNIFQCDNGHIACSSCYRSLRNKCPTCALPIGNLRCRMMERIVEAVIVPCPNAKHGCTEKFFYGKELAHEKECSLTLCYCPAPNCRYTGVYKDLYSHYDANHKNTWNRFVCGNFHNPCLSTDSKISVLQEYKDGPLVVVQCFEVPIGMFVTVNCIAPSAPGVGEFSYNFSYTIGDNTTTFGSKKMNRIQKVSFVTPEKDFMSIPCFMYPPYLVKFLRICIRRQVAEEEEEDNEEEEEEEKKVEEADESDVVKKVRRSTREKKDNAKG